ncbi:OmpA/MotB family protein [Paraglaciecola polaris]|uniref:Chemotaxis protein MotB-related protein n=1 Tax=Paraglaciecola polaris LMG 21857 TaxID=1129793 RepID=K6YG64_9ALTE|nr:OmpA family protein [Paraglaciecola polaris]GAC31729.1 chemotaxis protein MotB-related protein [Paraglaciecola polaris LMG 21857]
MDRFLSRGSAKVDEENPYWMSFSDLMSGLLVIFILAAVALIIELTQKSQNIDASIAEFKKAEEARSSILFDIKEELAKQNIHVEIVENDTVLRIPEGTLSFESAKDTLPQDETTQLEVRAIGMALHKAITTNERWKYLDTVFVEGHTDSVGIWYRGKGNWGLSADRAVSIWKLWQTEIPVEPKLIELKNFNDQLLFSVSGYADTRRVDLTEETEEQRAKNRRIDIRFTVKKPKIEDYEKAKDV